MSLENAQLSPSFNLIAHVAPSPGGSKDARHSLSDAWRVDAEAGRPEPTSADQGQPSSFCSGADRSATQAEAQGRTTSRGFRPSVFARDVIGLGIESLSEQVEAGSSSSDCGQPAAPVAASSPTMPAPRGPKIRPPAGWARQSKSPVDEASVPIEERSQRPQVGLLELQARTVAAKLAGSVHGGGDEVAGSEAG